MKKEAKIILSSGISITIDEKDRFEIQNGQETIDSYDLSDLCDFMISKEYDTVIIYHHISTGEYMEYYLTRDKITWCYYSETKKN